MIEREMRRVADALAAVRMPAQPEEYDIHAAVADALDAAGLDYEHEYNLGPRCRIDFLIDGVGIEVKRGKPQKAPLLRQCSRYLACDQVEALILVLDTSVSLPRTLEGKPIIVFGLNRLWGVALP